MPSSRGNPMLRAIAHAEGNPRKKYVAIFAYDDGKERRVYFGGKGCMDFVRYSAVLPPVEAEAKRAAYIKRHRVSERWTDPMAPGTLSRYILWEYPTIREAIREYKLKFNI